MARKCDSAVSGHRVFVAYGTGVTPLYGRPEEKSAKHKKEVEGYPRILQRFLYDFDVSRPTKDQGASENWVFEQRKNDWDVNI